MYLDVVGPYQQVPGPAPESVKKMFGADPADRAHPSVERILGSLARRAYRRPVTAAELQGLVEVVKRVQKDGEPFEEGLCLALQQILVSPHFLFRIENESAPATNRSLAADHDLASRLSYFLWSSMPDDELFQMAERGTLRGTGPLEAQVRRMLRDEKVSALVENFGGQWLRTRALESHVPDRVKFPEFTDYTRQSMEKETYLFFAHIIREDCSILDFIDGSYTFLNQRLADFYNIPGVKGHEFRKVDLQGTERAGVWTQAGVLTVSSYPNRTSPVLRGRWILETLLNTPPPPPPPNVPSLDEQSLLTGIPLKQVLDRHRSSAACASCHARIDPLGFALEHFDAIGRWRDRDGALPIDTAGVLPDGRSFDDHRGLKTLMKARANEFTEGLVEKLMIYAVGRGLDASDRKNVAEIAGKAAADGYRFSSLVLGIVRSDAFQNRSGNREGG
jgi:hypothetical protein